MNIRTHFLLPLVTISLLFLAACDPEPTPTPTPVPRQGVTAVAANPPNVWIDSPLPGEGLTLSQIPAEVMAHTSALSGEAELEIRNMNDEILAVFSLGSPEEMVYDGGQLGSYRADWMPVLEPLVEAAEGSLTLKLVVKVSGLSSDPVVFTILKETATPTPTETVTPTVTSTDTPTFTPTMTASPTETLTSTPTDTPTATTTPTDSPTPTLTPTYTPSPTDTPLPPVEVDYVPKPAQPCKLFAGVDAEPVIRVGPGPNRGPLGIMEPDTVYDVTGKNDVNGLWWLFAYTDLERDGWVSDADVYTQGSCLLVAFVDAPSVVRPSAPKPPPSQPNEPSAPNRPVIHYFYSDYTTLPYVDYEEDIWIECTNLRWSVEFVDEVYLDGVGVVGNGQKSVCMQDIYQYGNSRTYTLVIYKGGQAVGQQSVTININYDYGG